jgi:hypothetical protein
MKNKETLTSFLEKHPNVSKEIAKSTIVQNYYTKRFNAKPQKEYKDTDERISTNPSFPNFFQSIYHVGTLQQFLEYSHMSENLPVMTTFHYMFDVFKKGIFVEIKNGNIEVFLPFSKYNYTNDWGRNLKIKGHGGTIGDYKDVVSFEEKNHFNSKFANNTYNTMIEKNTNKWYANYFFFRTTIYKNGELRFKCDEGDKSIVNFLNLLTELCYDRVIPDVKFFINPRDFPIVKKDMYHPYDRLYKNTILPFLGEKYPLNLNNVPIFSQSITNEYSDLLIPNDDDIVSLLDETSKPTVILEWTRKEKRAVFRGSATGCGVYPKNNPRLKLIEIASGNELLIDAKLTGLNRKIKVDENGIIDVIDQRKYPIINKAYKEKYYQTSEKQSSYRYIIHIQGHVAAFRLTKELSYNSLILKVESDWKTWYSDELIGFKPFENSLELHENAHFISIKSDLSDLIEIIKWCRTNDNICMEIANNGYKYWKENLSNSSHILTYLQNTLKRVSENQLSPKYSGLILIPFRDTHDDSQEQLDKLTDFLDACMKAKHGLDYLVCIQTDDKPFNRGRLLNRSVILNKEYDYYIFHNSYIFPTKKLFNSYYTFPTVPKFTKGILLINKTDFYSVNGYPNDFWTHGEDNAILYRLVKNKIQVISTDMINLSISEETKELLVRDKKNWINNGLCQFK